jgi:hypothetical protein
MRQSNNPPGGKTPRHRGQKKPRQLKSNIKSIIVTFFGVKGNVRKEFVPTGQIVNSGFYCDVLWRLRQNVGSGRSKLWLEQNWLLQHESFRPHPGVSGEKQNGFHPPHTVLPLFGTL